MEEIEDENALSITELPVGRWTEEYKKFLMAAASEDGKDKTPFIEYYTDRSDYKTVHFEITMSEDPMNTARQEGFLKKFKLTTTLSANMLLFDANGVIKKYDTPEQILEDFFHLRLDFYEKRRTAVLRKLKKASLLLENKVRYISLVCDGKINLINLVNRECDELCAELKERGLKKETEVEEEVAAGEEKPQGNASKMVPGTEYDYLLSIAIGSFTYEKLHKLEQQRDAKKKEFDELTNTLSKSLWLRDLDALDHQLDEQDKIDAKDEAERRKLQEKAREPARKRCRLIN